MNPILTDLSPATLAYATRDNLDTFFQRLAHSACATVAQGEGWYAWRVPVLNPWFNGVLVHQPSLGVPASELDDAFRFFAGYEGNLTWWFTPAVAVEPWRERLAECGFQYNADTPGMAIDLNTLAADASPKQCLEIRHVTSADAVHHWSATMATGFGVPDWQPVICDCTNSLGLDLPFRNYLGLLDGEPVATSTLFLGAGVAGVYNVATLPAARGQGIGTAMTLATLLDGRKLGYQIGVLHASPMGLPVYQRMGFVEVCRMEHCFGPVPGASATATG